MFVDLSILNADLDHIEAYLERLPYLTTIHMDIMDGKFVKQTSFGSDIVKRVHDSVGYLRIIDVHLMTVNPENYFEEYKNAGADYITFHIETGNVKENIERIHKMGLKAGVALNPETSVSEVYPYLEDLDMVLIMSVHPGLGGQKYITDSTEKLKKLREWKEEKGLSYFINVDGGINFDTYQNVLPYNDLAVVGSAITKAENYPDVFMKYTMAFQKR